MTYKNITIDQACDFALTLNLSNPDGSRLNVGSYVFSGNIKASYYSNTVIDSLNVVAVDAPNGNISIQWAAANSAKVDAKFTYVYDVMGTTGGTTTKIVNGLLFINPSVTNVNPTG